MFWALLAFIVLAALVFIWDTFRFRHEEERLRSRIEQLTHNLLEEDEPH